MLLKLTLDRIKFRFSQAKQDASIGCQLSKKIIVFASGRGTNFKAIQEAIASKKLDLVVSALFSDKENAPALDYARSQKIDCVTLQTEQFDFSFEYDEALVNKVHEFSPDFIVLAGYMRFIPQSLVEAYENKIVNIHPSLLPAFAGKGMYGMKVHEAVHKSGVKVSGASVHFVNEFIDEGSIITQESVPLNGYESVDEIATKVLAIEHQLYPKALDILAKGNYEIIDNRVCLK